VRALEQHRRSQAGLQQYHYEIGGLGPWRYKSAGEVVLTLGATTSHPPLSALILNGLVKVSAVSGPPSAPDRVLLSIRGPGSLVGEEAAIVRQPTRETSDGRVTNVVAVNDVTAAVFPAGTLRSYLRDHPAALLAVTEDICQRLSEAEDRIASASRDNADRRLARLLCELEPYGSDVLDGPEPGTLLPIRLSQAELASWIGVCRETVDRVLRSWRDRGIVATRYCSIVVHDFRSLARIAGTWPATTVPGRVTSDTRAVPPGIGRAPGRTV
jgi:CRP/FNR family transcriptional regulator, cyclic AMP receptor protein